MRDIAECADIPVAEGADTAITDGADPAVIGADITGVNVPTYTPEA